MASVKNDTCQILAYMHDVSLIGDITRIERNAHALLNACKNMGLAVNIGKTKNTEVGYRMIMVVNEHITVGSNFYEK